MGFSSGRALRPMGWLIIAWPLAGACAPVTPAAGIGFGCTVEGEAMIKGSMGAQAVCSRIKARIDARLGTPTRAAGASDNYPERIVVNVRFARSGTASAQLTRVRGAEVSSLPEINISVSDRPIDAATVDSLADQLAQQLAGQPTDA